MEWRAVTNGVDRSFSEYGWDHWDVPEVGGKRLGEGARRIEP